MTPIGWVLTIILVLVVLMFLVMIGAINIAA